MIADKNFCMSSYLAFRFVVDDEKCFKEGLSHIDHELIPVEKKKACTTASDIDRNIRESLEKIDLKHSGILLSGGMDSAILASYMPKGTKAYTARCIGANAVDETEQAGKYCDLYDLEHVIVDVTWEDYVSCMDELALFQGAPIISNEPQAYKIVKKAKEDGIRTMIHGDTADIEFGGMSLMLSKDWTLEEWIDRSIYVRPETVLKSPSDVYYVYENYRLSGGMADNQGFINDIYGRATAAALTLACRSVEMEFLDPYEEMHYTEPLDLTRIRNGESKYLIRELFSLRYPSLAVPEKKPMSRPANTWMADWKGPEREEFKQGCIDALSGEQKLLVYSLERFLNNIDA